MPYCGMYLSNFCNLHRSVNTNRFRNFLFSIFQQDIYIELFRTLSHIILHQNKRVKQNDVVCFHIDFTKCEYDRNNWHFCTKAAPAPRLLLQLVKAECSIISTNLEKSLIWSSEKPSTNIKPAGTNLHFYR